MLTGSKCALPVDGTSSEEVRTIACDVLDKVFYFLHSILGDPVFPKLETKIIRKNLGKSIVCKF